MVDRMAMLRVSRETLAGMLREHGEDDLAERALFFSDDELARIGTLGAYYAFSEDAMALGGSMGGTRALSLATIDVLEDTGRDLRWSRTEWELQSGRPDRFVEGTSSETESFDGMPRNVRYLLTRASEHLTLLILRRGVLYRRTPRFWSGAVTNCGPNHSET
jgi:hypothetical protein